MMTKASVPGDRVSNPGPETSDIVTFVTEIDAWGQAYAAFEGFKYVDFKYVRTGVHDLKPLAAQLLSGNSVPRYVAQHLGTLLDPPRGWRGGRLKYIRPKRKSDGEFIKELFRKLVAGHEYNFLIKNGERKKVAIGVIEDKYHVGRTWVYEAIGMTGEKFATELLSIMDARHKQQKVSPPSNNRLAD